MRRLPAKIAANASSKRCPLRQLHIGGNLKFSRWFASNLHSETETQEQQAAPLALPSPFPTSWFRLVSMHPKTKSSSAGAAGRPAELENYG
jgi:hypothetical protein